MTVAISTKGFSQPQIFHVQIRHAKTYYSLETMEPFAHVQSILCVEVLVLVGSQDQGHYGVLSLVSLL